MFGDLKSLPLIRASSTVMSCWIHLALADAMKDRVMIRRPNMWVNTVNILLISPPF